MVTQGRSICIQDMAQPHCYAVACQALDWQRHATAEGEISLEMFFNMDAHHQKSAIGTFSWKLLLKKVFVLLHTNLEGKNESFETYEVNDGIDIEAMDPARSAEGVARMVETRVADAA